MTAQEFKAKFETETGLKFTISKGVGSMKEYTIFQTRSIGGQPVEVDFNYGQNFIAPYPQMGAFFSNLRQFCIQNKFISK